MVIIILLTTDLDWSKRFLDRRRKTHIGFSQKRRASINRESGTVEEHICNNYIINQKEREK